MQRTRSAGYFRVIKAEQNVIVLKKGGEAQMSEEPPNRSLMNCILAPLLLILTCLLLACRDTAVYLEPSADLNIFWCQGDIYNRLPGHPFKRTLWKAPRNKQGYDEYYCTSVGYALDARSLFVALAWNNTPRRVLQEMNPQDGKMLWEEDLPMLRIDGIEPSPDGSLIAITGNASNGEGVYLLDRKKGSLSIIARCSGYSHPFWDGSGRQLIYSNRDDSGNSTIYRYSLDAEAGTALLKPISAGSYPVTLDRLGTFIYYDDRSRHLILRDNNRTIVLPLQGNLLAPESLGGLSRVYGTNNILLFHYRYWGFETYLVAGPSYSSSKMVLPDVTANHVLAVKAEKL
jgi:hypothetical protein